VKGVGIAPLPRRDCFRFIRKYCTIEWKSREWQFREWERRSVAKVMEVGCDGNKHCCILCDKSIIQKRNSGYSNLYRHSNSHFKTMTAEQITELEYLLLGFQTVLSFTNSTTSSDRNLYKWLSFVVESLSPFNVVQRECFRKLSGFGSISYDTLLKYLKSVARVVEKLIVALFPDRSG
jgi:hypothetical protein